MPTTSFNYNQSQDADRLLLIQNNVGAGDIECQFALDVGTIPPQWNFIARIYIERRGGPRQGIFLEKFLYGEENTLISEQELTALAPLGLNLTYRVLARFRPFIEDGILEVEWSSP